MPTPDVPFKPDLPAELNMADWFLDARLREGRGGDVAIVCGDDRWTYAQVSEAATRMADLLRHSGVGVEDRVLLALPDGMHFAAAFFGALKAGAVVAMV